MTDPVDYEEGIEFVPLDLFGRFLLEGFTFDAHHRQLLAGAVTTAMNVTGLGLEVEIAGFLDIFERDPEARLIMSLAADAGLTYSEARAKWSNPDDIAAELAWRAINGAEQWERCPSCGTKPEDMVHDDGRGPRPISNGRWKFVSETCYVCSTLEKLNDGVEDFEKGRRYRIKPRELGEPMIDD